MKKILALALALIMVLAFAACGGGAAEAPAEEPAVEEEAPVVESVTGDASGEMASGEMGEASGELASDEAAAPAEADASSEASEAGEASAEDNGPVDSFDLIVNAPVIGEGAAAIDAVGGDAGKVVVEATWVGSNGDTVTAGNGVFQAGDYTLSLTFKAADGVEMNDPVNVKFVGGASTEYVEVASSGVDENGAPVYEMIDAVTLTAGEATGEPAA